jgi:signal-transduction protein with cAMP-binding, CBS, and nucleotidyltransferase domain
MYNVPARMTDLGPSIQDRLSAHRLLAGAPPDQLAWLAAHGRLVQLEPGAVLSPKGKPVQGLYIMLSGHMTISLDRGAGPQ